MQSRSSSSAYRGDSLVTRGGDDFLVTLGKIPSKEKFRRMACLTMLFCGMCPYEDRCVFLHDPQTRTAHGGKCRPIKQTKTFGGGSRDSFFWPDMEAPDVDKNLDPMTGLPSPNQSYTIPQRFIEPRSQNHDMAIYSIWFHFISFLQSCRSGTSLHLSDLEAASLCNKHVKNRARLSVFVHMCALDDGPTESIESLAKGLGSPPGTPVARVARGGEEFKPEELDESKEVASGSPTSVSHFPRDLFAAFNLEIVTGSVALARISRIGSSGSIGSSSSGSIGSHESKVEFSPTSVTHGFSFSCPPSPMLPKDVCGEPKSEWGRLSYRTVLCED